MHRALLGSLFGVCGVLLVTANLKASGTPTAEDPEQAKKAAHIEADSSPQDQSGDGVPPLPSKGAVQAPVIPQQSGCPASTYGPGRCGAPDDSDGWDNVVAVLIAAILTFFATQYQERVGAARRRAEQLRDRQIANLGDVAKKLDALARQVGQIAREFQEQRLQLDQPLASRGVLLAEERVAAGGWLEQCRREQVELGLVLMDMRVLRTVGPARELAEKAHRYCADLVLELVSLSQGIAQDPSAVLGGAAAEVEALAVEFSSVALDSVAK